MATLFDEDGQPKQAYYAVQRELLKDVPPVSA